MSGEPTGKSVPVTVLTGPLGAGKTTLVNRVLRNPGGRRIAVILNDMGELNVDAELVERETDNVVDLSNGCICCRLQGDLVESVGSIAASREVDAVLVEASGISEPIPIARALTDAQSDRPFHLDTMVSVVDAFGFWKAFDPSVDPPGDPERPLTDVLVESAEFCDVLLLNKCDTVPDDELDRVEATVRELQSRASLYRTTHCDVSTDVVVDTGLFDFDAVRDSQGWRQALAHDDHDHAAAERHGVESFVFESDRPFAPEALDGWFEEWDGELVRAKGFAYVASRPDEVVGISLAGPSVQAGPIGEWGADEPRTRLVLIGRDLDEESMTERLESLLADPSAVSERPDSLPRQP